MIREPSVTATLLETMPMDFDVPAGVPRSTEGALRLAPRQPTYITSAEAEVVQSTRCACILAPTPAAEQAAVLGLPPAPAPAPSAPEPSAPEPSAPEPSKAEAKAEAKASKAKAKAADKSKA